MAETKDKIRKKLIRRVQYLDREKLQTLEEFLSQLKTPDNEKKEILSYAGSLKDMDDEIFKELTDDLHNHRKTGLGRMV